MTGFLNVIYFSPGKITLQDRTGHESTFRYTKEIDRDLLRKYFGQEVTLTTNSRREVTSITLS